MSVSFHEPLLLLSSRYTPTKEEEFRFVTFLPANSCVGPKMHDHKTQTPAKRCRTFWRPTALSIVVLW